MVTTKEILREVGYPEDILVLDAETYFDKDYSLKKRDTNNYTYVSDDRFELIGWAAKLNGGDAKFLTGQSLQDRGYWDNTTVVMHNAPFDALLLAVLYGIHPPFIIDTLDLARHIEPRRKNSLAVLCERYDLPNKGDTNQFLGVHKADMFFGGDSLFHAPLNDTGKAMIEYACNDADRTYDLLHVLLPYLTNRKFELQIAKWTREACTRPQFGYDFDLADDLLSQMNDKLPEPPEGFTAEELTGSKVFFERMRALLGSDCPIKHGKKGPMLAIAQTDPGYKFLLNHPDDTIRDIMERRVALKGWPKHIQRIEKMSASAKAMNGHLPVPLKYYGSHSGRWSGTGGYNPQNMPARGPALPIRMRELIMAPDDHVLVIADLCQIEARIVDWLADQKDLLQAFRENRDIYCEFATDLVGHHIRKPRADDNPVVAKYHGTFRQMGKVGILGGGFGASGKAILTQARDGYGINIDIHRADKIVETYRKSHAMVVKFWAGAERCFRMATMYPGVIYELPHGLYFYREENATVIELPSGRKLYYVGTKVVGRGKYRGVEMPDYKRNGKGTIRMWHGLIVENIVQATARDIIAINLLNVEQAGYRVPLTVHDDISAIVPEKTADEHQKNIENIMRIVPDWAEGLPVEVESQITKRYCK